MAASLHDSAIYRGLMHDPEIRALFTDTAEVRSMLLVEGALARAQGECGAIPELSAAAIHRASLELPVDPGGLSDQTGADGVPVPALVARFREAMQAPEHAQWVHFGATSQDILDTALVLRLRQVLAICEARAIATAAALGRLARAHADTPMAGRTWGQVATPTSFGAVAAGWGGPLLDLLEELPALRDRVLRVSLSGAAGTLSAMGDKGAAVRAALARGLALADPGGSWHTDRTGLAALSGWAVRVTATLGRMGADLALMSRSGTEEVVLPAAGGSSTMPQKRNPVMPSLLQALAGQVAALDGAMQQAALHREQRDGAAWMLEWLSLPQVCLGLGRALAVAQDLAAGVAPRPDRMAGNIDDGTGLIYAEALQFRLAATMPRPEAQAAVKDLCARVRDERRPLPDLAAQAFPGADLDGLFRPAAHLGLAPDAARAFAARAGAFAGSGSPR